MRGIRRRQVELALEETGLEVDPRAIENGLLEISRKQGESWLRGEVFQPHDGARHFVGSLEHELTLEHETLVTEALLLSEVTPELNPADEIGSTLEALKSNGFRIGIVCDVGLAPSTVLRETLADAG